MKKNEKLPTMEDFLAHFYHYSFIIVKLAQKQWKTDSFIGFSSIFNRSNSTKWIQKKSLQRFDERNDLTTRTDKI